MRLGIRQHAVRRRGDCLSQRIQIALDQLAEAVSDELGDIEAKRLAAATEAANAAVEANRVRDIVGQRDAELLKAAKEIADLKAAAIAKLPLWRKGMKVETDGEYRLPDEGFGGSVKVNRNGVTFHRGKAWPDGGILFDVEADDFTSIGTTFDHPSPTVGAEGKFSLPDCVRTVARNTRLIRPVVRKVNTFVKADRGAYGTVLDSVDAEGYSSYVLYSAGGDNSFVLGGRIGAGKVETPLRANVEVGDISEGFTVVGCDVTANPRKQAIDIRHVTNALIARCIIRQPARRADGKIMTSVRLGADNGHGCRDVMYWRNLHIGGQLYAMAQVSGVLGGNRWRDVDPAINDDIPINAVAGTLRVFDTIAFYKGAFPTNPQPIATIPVDASNKWEQQP